MSVTIAPPVRRSEAASLTVAMTIASAWSTRPRSESGSRVVAPAVAATRQPIAAKRRSNFTWHLDQVIRLYEPVIVTGERWLVLGKAARAACRAAPAIVPAFPSARAAFPEAR